ncbi:MAG: uracil phosphoribosyltransferase [Halobacteriovorax sp.]|nr:uracil phosphoribosyltransferase [Halobacteriovorax sp.]|tara:strand:- start:65383 stop:66201 length:819 start_codon:yes stop_codon:yes gene_type:complete
MPKDCQYSDLNFRLNEVETNYGDNVHIVSNPFTLSMLAKLGSPESVQPRLNKYVEDLYMNLLQQVLNHLAPTALTTIETRMKEHVKEGEYSGLTFKKDQKFISVNLARAGIFPSHKCFEELHYLFNAEGLRQDHFYINRKVDDQGQVVGVDVSGSKIGGPQEDAIVLFPDPMGATGGSLSYCIDHYKKNVEGMAKKYVAMHLIVTPEYIQRMQKDHPDVEIFAIRLDRGLSDSSVLNSVPGTNPELERGLTDNQYIVPGAGGVGEILNNSFV